MSSDQPGPDDFTVEPRTMRFQGVPAQEPEHAEAPDTRGLSPEDQATIEALRPGTALLIVLRGPNTGARFLLDDTEVSAGRHPDSDIFLDDVTVSRKHALFAATPDGYVVRDFGSLNGTYVNRERIDEIALHTGDEVQIGKFRLVYYAA
ncbi:signal peptide protein [Intrasporangium oryzae NRRL B-24470]|uniref:Signal peptide protein n=1 Tax=Intrasporangium oryzae NRRL B-24470 TaxID=1386089 RepID=W9G295_9MICO|nr:FHA domain-containing protein [Intrasporangium oryzae]EWT00095.1 signal peptide protein [Intrasporangium oryzae NRRL B-24470]